MKHILGYILKIAISHKSLAKHSNAVLLKIKSNLDAYALNWQRNHDPKPIYFSMLDHVAKYCYILAGNFALDSQTTPIIKCQHAILTSNTVNLLFEWILSHDSVYMIQLFIIPLLTQFSYHRENWINCTFLITRILESVISHISLPILSNFLIASACNRPNSNNRHDKTVCIESINNQRLWAIEVLGAMKYNDKQVSLY
jgi:hypothetical protein